MNELLDSDPQRILKAVKLLAAAFPRAAWRPESDAAYSMALIDSGATPEEVNAAVRTLIRTEEQLPSVATILDAIAGHRRDDVQQAWRCPSCGSDKVAVLDSTPVLCFDCDWQPDGGTT
jgi:hypothetical protein